MSLFPSIFAPLPFSLCMEMRVRRMFFLSGGGFLPSFNHGLDFLLQLVRGFNQSISQNTL